MSVTKVWLIGVAVITTLTLIVAQRSSDQARTAEPQHATPSPAAGAAASSLDPPARPTLPAGSTPSAVSTTPVDDRNLVPSVSRPAGDYDQDSNASVPADAPTLPAAADVTDADARRILHDDLRGRPRPPAKTAKAAEVAASRWVRADAQAAGIWTDIHIKAAQSITAGAHVDVVVIWVATDINEGVELHRSTVRVTGAPEDPQVHPRD